MHKYNANKIGMWTFLTIYKIIYRYFICTEYARIESCKCLKIKYLQDSTSILPTKIQGNLYFIFTYKLQVVLNLNNVTLTEKDKIPNIIQVVRKDFANDSKNINKGYLVLNWE